MRKITYDEFQTLATRIANMVRSTEKPYRGVYGVPRGGVPLAVALGHQLDLPVLSEPFQDALIADDISDSGSTLSALLERFPGADTAVLVKKDCSSVAPTYVGFSCERETWVVFPWETKETPAEDAVLRLLQVIGEDAQRDGLRDTPRRVIKSYRDLFAGYTLDAKSVLGTQFEADGPNDEMIICRDIELYSTCEHHMLPFFGRASVGYIPGHGKIVGLSKLARVVEVFSRRLQNQERITRQVAEAIQGSLGAIAVGVVIEADHFCMRARGVNKQNSKMVTSCMLGLFRTDHSARTEFLRLIGK